MKFKMNLMELIELLKSKFGEKNLRLTFACDNSYYDSSFGQDNISHLTNWAVMMHTKLFAGSITTLALVVRVFDFNDCIVVTRKEKQIKIPKKRVYHFSITKDDVVGFDKNETYTNQNTNIDTGKYLIDEEGVEIKSSVDLLKEVMG